MRRQALRRLAALAAVLSLPACSTINGYFNGIYNARAAARAGDRLLERGRDAEAVSSFAASAAKAETVLARYPRSRWAAEATFLAGRGAAFADQCALGIRRLQDYLATSAARGTRREIATVALARCYVRERRYGEALRLLEPLRASRDRSVARGASLWSARAAIALGRTEDALAYLGTSSGALQWELVAASLAAREYQRAESLLVLRAESGDYRDELVTSMQWLWREGRFAGPEQIVARFAGARAPADQKARVHIVYADLLMHAGRDDSARTHLVRAQRLTTDTLLDREAGVRLTQLDISALETTVDIENTLRSGRRRGASLALRRLEDNLLFVKLLEETPDYTGASLFLASEVARDSLRAPKLARALLRRAIAVAPQSALAPKILLAAAALDPDSADVYRERVATDYAQSPFARVARGEVLPGDAFRQTDAMLRPMWTSLAARLADSLQRLRPTTQQAGATP